MFDFTHIFIGIHTSLAIVGCFFNLFLIYLALFRTPRVIRSYTTLIINFAITDFFACFFDLFVEQRIIPAGTTLGYISSGICKHFGPRACYIGYSLMLHCLSHSLWSLLLSFSYRYYILFKPAPSRLFNAIIIFIIYQFSFFQFVSFLWAFDDPEEIREILHQKFPHYELSGVVTGTKNIINFSALFTILHMTVPITPVYICILILRRLIKKRLSVKGISVTKDTKNMHTQLLMALTYQAVIPGFYFFSVISYTIGQLGIYNHPALEYFTFSSVLFIPVFSPLASFVFVTPYRKFLIRLFYKIAQVEYIETSLSYIRGTSQVAAIG
ncbi:unnamed protein product [Caenorhabditis bovis]|uniref:G-protein coupled receptors family 1 profile domain-containing protein n=1 Tax=Caenorhabditis bovis TaxID=2654633 RepID=A0A8S1F9W6_9PELO|nr:unnamed protein product [Caenorhabditis bovis]